jgi:transcriptional regulator with XRE-family HTH domain
MGPDGMPGNPGGKVARRMPRPTARDHGDLRLLVILLRALRCWDQSELAAASGVSRTAISSYETGDKAPTRRTQEKLAAAVGLPHALLDPLLTLIGALRRAWEEGGLPGEAAAGLVREAGGAAAAWMETARAAALVFLAGSRGRGEAPPDEARRRARDTWARLTALPAAQRRLAVPLVREVRTRAMVELLRAESAAADGEAAREMEELAAEIAERVAGGHNART